MAPPITISAETPQPTDLPGCVPPPLLPEYGDIVTPNASDPQQHPPSSAAVPLLFQRVQPGSIHWICREQLRNGDES